MTGAQSYTEATSYTEVTYTRVAERYPQEATNSLLPTRPATDREHESDLLRDLSSRPCHPSVAATRAKLPERGCLEDKLCQKPQQV